MDKNKIKKKYNEKIQNLVKLNKHYYDLNKPLVNDDEYDQIKAEILILEKKYNFLKSENSPSKTVGFKPSKTFKKVFHRVPMLSLSNAFDEEDLINFEKKINNFLDQKVQTKSSIVQNLKLMVSLLRYLIKMENFTKVFPEVMVKKGKI